MTISRRRAHISVSIELSIDVAVKALFAAAATAISSIAPSRSLLIFCCLFIADLALIMRNVGFLGFITLNAILAHQGTRSIDLSILVPGWERLSEGCILKESAK